MEFTEEHKNRIERAIVETVISALENGNLAESELSQIANFVLEKIDQIKTHDELVIFLSDLSSRWPIFTNLETLEKGEIEEKVEDEVAEGVLTLAQSGKIEEAVNLAKTITDK